MTRCIIQRGSDVDRWTAAPLTEQTCPAEATHVVRATAMGYGQAVCAVHMRVWTAKKSMLVTPLVDEVSPDEINEAIKSIRRAVK